MFPVIDLGPFAIQAPGLILLLSLFLGTWLMGRFAKALGTNGDAIENSLLIGLLAGLAGARIGFLLQNPSVFTQNPLNLVSPTPSMLNTGFGLLVGGITILVLAQKKRLPLWPTLDTLSPLILSLFMGVHLANLASGDAYGLPTRLPWGIALWGATRHPVQVYALLLALGVAAWLWFRTQGLKSTGYQHSGILAAAVTGALSAITLFTRAFVAQKLLLWRIDLIQLLALALLAALVGLIYQKRFRPPKRVAVFISMGSNLDPKVNLQQGLASLSKRFKLRRSSSIYQTEDVRPSKEKKIFINQVVEIETDLAYPELRNTLKAIEVKLGRVRGDKDTVPLDMDILTYDGDVFVFESCLVPDPGLMQYHYIAEPLAEIAADFRHPANGMSIQEILDKIPDQNEIKRIEEVKNGTQR